VGGGGFPTITEIDRFRRPLLMLVGPPGRLDGDGLSILPVPVLTLGGREGPRVPVTGDGVAAPNPERR